MQKLILTLLPIVFIGQSYAANQPPRQNESALILYKTDLASWKTHKFDDNQIRSFVYYWYGLHDKHVAIEKSYELLNESNLEMIFPEITVHNFSDYKKWYDGVGKNILSNQHIVKKIDISMLPNHQYKLNVTVNWQAIDKNHKFINIDANQQWLLVDGQSESHPYIQKYKVLGFTPHDQ